MWEKRGLLPSGHIQFPPGLWPVCCCCFTFSGYFFVDKAQGIDNCPPQKNTEFFECKLLLRASPFRSILQSVKQNQRDPQATPVFPARSSRGRQPPPQFGRVHCGTVPPKACHPRAPLLIEIHRHDHDDDDNPPTISRRQYNTSLALEAARGRGPTKKARFRSSQRVN